MLKTEEFLMAVSLVPLVSIDLVITDQSGRMLLGERTNRPAQGYWFVPGGRIMKGENHRHAFDRICHTELSVAFDALDGRRLLGIFDHFYEDNFLGVQELSTQYVVLAYHASVDSEKFALLPDRQHRELRWWSPRDIRRSKKVHTNTVAYLAHL